MIANDVLQELRNGWRSVYPIDLSQTGIVCPLCGSGSGPNGTGITADPRHPGQLHCWACGFSGDILDLVQADPAIQASTLPEAAAHVAAVSGIDLVTEMRSFPQPVKEETGRGPAISLLKASVSSSDAFSDDGLTNSPGSAYLASRGISVATARMLGVRYEPAWRHPNAPTSVPGTPRLVIPTADGNAVTRDIRIPESIPAEQQRFVKQNLGPSRLLNAAALGQESPVVIVEGVFDALSVMEVGVQALALNSTSNVPQLVTAVQNADHVPPLILALDNDDAGKRAQSQLETKLHAAGAWVSTVDLTGGLNDPNDALLADKAGFGERVKTAVKDAAALASAAERAALVPMTMTANAFWAAVSHPEMMISTGIRSVDVALGGGLTPFGITVLGGRTGTGKTSFALQIASSVISGGRPVLYVPLEMSALQLTAKNLVRFAAISSPVTGAPCSAIDILTGKVPDSLKPIAEEYFASVAPMLYIMPLMSEDTAGTVVERACEIKNSHGVAPLVIIDYIQIMPVADPRLPERQVIHQNVSVLKDASDEIPFFVISSFNRAAYTAGKESARSHEAMVDVLESAFKESGTLEYTGGSLLGLWVPDGARDGGDRTDLDLYVIKNRWGQRLSRPVGLTLVGSSGEFQERWEGERVADDELPPEWRDAPEF